MQFDTTINEWHTCPNTGRSKPSNPCSEYMHLDDSACNLASLNLMQFVEPDGSFAVAAFRHAVDIMITAQDIVVDRSSYPTPEIAATAHAYRELGLGYANLGALLMSLGLPYDSDAGREYAAAVTALMCGEAHRHSAAVAAVLGPYEGYARNREPQLGVIEKHRAHAYKLDPALVPLDLLAAAREAWDGAREAARAPGVRDSPVTVPESASVEDIEEAYIQAWKLGLKAVAIYRDGCKKTQPLNTAKPGRAEGSAPAVGAVGKPEPVRRRLPNDRQALCHKFDVAGHEGYVHVGFFEDGTPGEIFIKMAKEGSTISGLMDTIGVLTSMALQYGVPLEVLVSKFSHVRFEPSGFTKNPDIPMAKSLIDYVFRFLGSRFLSGEARAAVGLVEREAPRAPGTVSAVAAASPAAHAPAGPNPT